METLYKINTDELTLEFLESIKSLFPHKAVEISIKEADRIPLGGDRRRDIFAAFPSGLKLTRDEINDRRPEYLTMAVDHIVMPSRDERYER